ncbi:MAG: SDR family oxidoreductase [Deltaproteobacteria bacterium]|nr:SDR family oxidoreductase [Deltaproteobacteria bacterium]
MTDKLRFRLNGSTALVTGGGGFLGPEHAIALLAAGCQVVLADISHEGCEAAKARISQEFSGDHPRCDAVVCDISDENQVRDLAEKLENSGMSPDILVNNAALNPKMKQDHSDSVTGSVEGYSIEELRREIDVGLVGAFICSKIFGSRMAERKKGVLVHVASDLAIQAPDQRVYSPSGQMEDVRNFKPIGYSLVKTGMLGLNRYLATYWAHCSVRSNCLIPGAVFNHQPAHLVENVKNRVPLRRWARPDEYREALVFLASSASSYMTGKEIVLDGGRSIW